MCYLEKMARVASDRDEWGQGITGDQGCLRPSHSCEGLGLYSELDRSHLKVLRSRGTQSHL